MPKLSNSSRDNFTQKTKKLLAERVGFRCSFPGCNQLTIGPNQNNPEEVVRSGEAAHIHAAAERGPRYHSGMSAQERSSPSNGIWVCSYHAKIIDTDPDQYTPETLLKFKQTTEAETYHRFENRVEEIATMPTTLVSLDIDLIFEAIWNSEKDGTWKFVVKKFILGGDKELKEYNSRRAGSPMLNYVIIETQGDGRFIKGDVIWELNSQNETEISCSVFPKHTGSKHPDFGDPLPDQTVASAAENNVVGHKRDKEAAKTALLKYLNLPLGAYKPNILLGSLITMYYRLFAENLGLFSRVVKMEIVRMMTIPPYQTGTAHEEPQLGFLNRVIDVNIHETNGLIATAHIELEWWDGTTWKDIVEFKIFDPDDPGSDFEVPDYVKILFEEAPRQKFKRLISPIDPQHDPRKVSPQAVFDIFTNVFPAIVKIVTAELQQEVYGLFVSHDLTTVIFHQHFDYEKEFDLELLRKWGVVSEFGLDLHLKGYRPAGVNAFTIYQKLHFQLNNYQFEIGNSPGKPWITRTYSSLPPQSDLEYVAEKWLEAIYHDINIQIEWAKKKSNMS